MAMTRSTPILICGLLLVASGCGVSNRVQNGPSVDCSVADAYEFLNINNFTAIDSGWYYYADTTPQETTIASLQAQYPNVPPIDLAKKYGLAYQQAVTLDAPGRCGDTRVLELVARGYNFWGAGFADWQHETSKADGTGYQGLSFWARSAPNTEKTFMFYVDDGRTIVLTRAKPDAAGVFSATGPNDQDLNGDGLLNAGDIAFDTECRIPPVQALCDPACYYGGVQPPAAAVCVPASNECGNQFHKYITTTEDWQLFLIPWNELVQWPCPNRLEGGINPADIRKFEIKVRQGTNYEIEIDNIAFYRLRADAGN
jgi:hypothetical protein